MNNKATKIVILALSALILVACCFGIGVMAQENESPEVEILFNNLEYGDNIAILYAVNVEGAEKYDLRLDFYTEADGAYVFDHSTSAYEMQDVKVNGVTEKYPVFKSLGIAPKHMTEIVYAQATLTVDGVEYKSNLSRFSITEYCYKRLYKDTNTTDDQKALYTHVLGYGTYAQKVLGYDVENTPANYFYVNADGAVVDSVTIGGTKYDFSAGIFKAGKEVVLKHNDLGVGEVATWNVAYKDAAGQTNATLNDGATVTISDKHVIATANVELVKVDFENFDPSTAVYDKSILTNADKYITSSVLETTLSDDGSSYKYAKVDVIDDPTEAGNKVLSMTGSWGAKRETSKTKIDVMAGEEGNLTVFSARMNIAKTASTTSQILDIFFGNESNSKVFGLCLTAPKTNEATAIGFYSSNASGPDKYANFGSFIPSAEWIDLRIEVYYNGTSYQVNGAPVYYSAKVFVDDYFIGDCVAYNGSGSEITYLAFNMLQQNTTVYLDDVSLIRTSGTFTPGEPEDSRKMPTPAAGALANGSGAYFTNAEKTGVRYDYNTYGGPAVYNSHPTFANAWLTPGKYAFYEKTGAQANAHTVIRYSTAAASSADCYEVVEMDLAFESDKSSFFVINVHGNGVKNSIFFSANADGTIRLDNYIDANTSLTDGYTFNPKLERFVFEADKWYNVRFEFHKDAVVTDKGASSALIKVFVDGVEYASLQGVDNGTSSGNYITLSLRAVDDDAWVCYDNLFIGYDE